LSRHGLPETGNYTDFILEDVDIGPTAVVAFRKNGPIQSDRAGACFSGFAGSLRYCGFNSRSQWREDLSKNSGEVSAPEVACCHLFLIFRFVLPLVPRVVFLPSLGLLIHFDFRVWRFHRLHRGLVCLGKSGGHPVAHSRSDPSIARPGQQELDGGLQLP